ncbi:hypothetical protein [Streptomyces sp. NPDC003247]|uniref:hypothetical protein n=1 Tax=Streptomyces sp. NPDC003247 TaxID=3364677 RepID=UPI00368EAE78
MQGLGTVARARRQDDGPDLRVLLAGPVTGRVAEPVLGPLTEPVAGQVTIPVLGQVTTPVLGQVTTPVLGPVVRDGPARVVLLRGTRSARPQRPAQFVVAVVQGTVVRSDVDRAALGQVTVVQSDNGRAPVVRGTVT